MSLVGCRVVKRNEAEKTTMRTIVDMAGRSVDIPEIINSVACFSSTCEAAIISLGKAEVLVGTTNFTDKNTIAYQLFPELLTLEKYDDDLSVEELILNKVQIILVKDLNKIEQYENAGLKVIYLNFDTILGTKGAISILGEILNISDRTQNCIKYIDMYEQLVKERLSSSNSKTFSAYYSRARYKESNLLTTYAAGHIYSEWINVCGGTIITKAMDLKESQGGVLINSEELLVSNPDIIFIGGYYRNAVFDEALTGMYKDSLKAIKERTVYIIPTSVTEWSIGSCEVGLVILWCAKMVYPDLFRDINMAKEIISFYNDVSDINISEELAQAILNSTVY
jgi:iron complex transport system substrate-binding protein